MSYSADFSFCLILYLYLFNCSQTKFLGIILVLWSFGGNCLFDQFFVSPFDSSSSKTGQTGSGQRALSSLIAFPRILLQKCDLHGLLRRCILMVLRAAPKIFPPTPPSPFSPLSYSSPPPQPRSLQIAMDVGKWPHDAKIPSHH